MVNSSSHALPMGLTIFMAAVALVFGAVGLGYGVELFFEVGDTYNVLFGLTTEIFGKHVGLLMLILEAFAVVSALVSLVALARVPFPGSHLFDFQEWFDRLRIVSLAEKLNIFVNLLVFTIGLAMWHEGFENFWAETATGFLKNLWDSASEYDRVDAQFKHTCCMWEFPTSDLELDMYIKRGTCPEDAHLSCETVILENFMKVTDSVRVGLLLQVIGIGVMVLFTFLYRIVAELADVEGRKVGRGSNRRITIVKKVDNGENLDATETEFEKRMRGAILKSNSEQDLNSDAEEARRVREKLQKRRGMALQKKQDSDKNLMNKGKGKKLKKGAGDDEVQPGDQKSLYEKMRTKVAEVARTKLHKLDAEEDEYAEAFLIEKRKKKLAKKAPWYTLHLAYGVAFSWVAFCAYFNLLFSLSLGVHVTQDYLTSAATALIVQMAISEPASIFVRTLVLPWLLGQLAGTHVAGVAEAAIDIGLGAVSGAGAVSFADRLMAKRRESAAIKAQAAIRRIRDRRVYEKMKKEREEAAKKDLNSNILKAAGNVADVIGADGKPVLDEESVRKAIARRGIKIKKKKVARGKDMSAGRSTVVRGGGERDARATMVSDMMHRPTSVPTLQGGAKPARHKARKPMRKQMTVIESMGSAAGPSLLGPAMPMDDELFSSSRNDLNAVPGPLLDELGPADTTQQLNKMLKKKKKLVRGKGERR